MSKDTVQKVTLEQWVNEHEKLLTASGVFGALTAYFSQLAGSGKYISFTSLVLFLLLTAEVYITLPWSRATIRLELFAYAFCGLLVATAFYFAGLYWHPLLSSTYGPSWLGIAYPLLLAWVYRKLGIFQWSRNYGKKHKWRGLIVNVILILLFGVITMALAFGTLF